MKQIFHFNSINKEYVLLLYVCFLDCTFLSMLEVMPCTHNMSFVPVNNAISFFFPSDYIKSWTSDVQNHNLHLHMKPLWAWTLYRATWPYSDWNVPCRLLVYLCVFLKFALTHFLFLPNTTIDMAQCLGDNEFPVWVANGGLMSLHLFVMVPAANYPHKE